MKVGILFGLAAALVSHGDESPVLRKELKDVPASQFCKVVDETASGDGKLAVAFGLTSGKPVDWSKFKDEGGGYSMDGEQPELANFLVDVKRDRVVALLRADHFGTRSSYNHEQLDVAWSEKGKRLVDMQSWKWHTASAALYVLAEDGSVVSDMDLLPVAKEQLRQILQRDHQVKPDQFSKYAVSLSDPKVTDEGRVTLLAAAEVPKSENDAYVSVKLEFTAQADAADKLSAVDLKVTKEEPAE